MVHLLLVIAVIVVVFQFLGGRAAADPSDGATVRCALGPHEVALYDENVEPIDFDTDADVVGITGFVVHTRRSGKAKLVP